jgi:putative glutamine amidotransferase
MEPRRDNGGNGIGRPLIGITVDCRPEPADVRTRGKLELNWNYAQCVSEAGGIPLLIPPQAAGPEVASVLDGLIIPGGNDIDASHWGEENHPEVKPIAPARFEGERALYGSASDRLPILGICYGCQFLNVMKGGTLIQHLPDVVGDDRHSGGTMQEYRVVHASRLAAIFGSSVVSGQSWHHQAIGRPGLGIEIVARNEDGTVEAFEASDRPWMFGVQWHPERTLEDAATRRLFSSLIEAAKAFRAARRAEQVEV